MATNTVQAQQQPGAPLDLNGEKKQDSLAYDKSNTDDWHNEQVRVNYRYVNSEKEYTPDTSIHTFHRKPYSQPWYQDLGNFGTATRNLQFTPDNRLGPTLGYHAFDIYRLTADSLKYYNTSAPYSEFAYNLGSKLEQRAHILHTQNIKPNWNFAVQYNKVTSDGYFLLNRSNHDNASLNTHFQSVNRRYKLFFAVIYNKNQQDENGGLADLSQLGQDEFNDRNTVDINYSNAASNTNNTPSSLVTNTLRDYAVTLHHNYSWGSTDTLYNEDSTNMSLSYTPRFSISHKFLLQGKLHTFKDTRPDSLRYADFFNYSFASNEGDSVFSQQVQNTIDNALLLNGFFGKKEKQVAFNAGVGIQADKFTTRFLIDDASQNVVSNYLTGGINKDAVDTGQWYYNATAKFYLTGIAAGNSLLAINIGKDIANKVDLAIGVQQNINNAPYSYTTYYNQFDTITNSFNKETITRIYGTISSNKYKFFVTLNNYFINNYLYFNSSRLPDQFAASFNITQLSLRKILKWRNVVFDNELLLQQTTGNAPVNVPQILGRHQLSYERYVFKNALKIATGGEIRYHSAYHSAAYSPIFNRFYYQNSAYISNIPAMSVFFNFKIKKFRAFIMMDQLQQLFTTNMIVAPSYAASNAMIRFGFNWVLIK